MRFLHKDAGQSYRARHTKFSGALLAGAVASSLVIGALGANILVRPALEKRASYFVEYGQATVVAKANDRFFLSEGLLAQQGLLMGVHLISIGDSTVDISVTAMGNGQAKELPVSLRYGEGMQFLNGAFHFDISAKRGDMPATAAISISYPVRLLNRQQADEFEGKAGI